MGTDQLTQRMLSRRKVMQLGASAGAAAMLASQAASAASRRMATTGAGTAAAEAGVPGGTLRVAQGADITQLDPHLANVTTEVAIFFNVYETLGAFNDETLLVDPLLATEWTWEDDDTSLVFKLRDGVTFHDGTPFDADDVKYSFERVLDPALGSAYTSLINDIKSIEVVDPLTVRFKTEGFSNKLIASLPAVAIIPSDSAETIATTPVGTGPFKWVEWLVNDHVRIDRFPEYWQSGLPYLDAVVFQPITDAETRNAALESGQADLLYNIALKDVARFESDPAFEVSLADPVDQPYDAYINTKRAPFDKLEARQAISYAIDRVAFVQNFMAGLGDVAYSPLAKTHWAFAPSLDGKYEYDLTKAAELLTAAGYPGGEGLSFKMVVPTGFPEVMALSTLVQAAVAELGGEATIDELDVGVWVDRLVSHDFDLAFDTDVKHASDPAITFGLDYLWYPSATNNLSQFTEDMAPGYTDLVAEASKEKDQEKRKVLYEQIQEQFMDIAVGPMVAFRSIPHVMVSAVEGFVPATQFHQDFSKVWMKPQ